MPSSAVPRWLTEKMTQQRQMSLVGAGSMFGAAFAVFLVKTFIMELLLWFQGIEGWGGFFLAMLLCAIPFGLYQLIKPPYLPDVDIPLDGGNQFLPKEKLEAVGYDALSAFNPPENAPWLIRAVMTLFFTDPRCVEAGRRSLKQYQALENFDAENCGRILKAVFKASRRIEFGKITDKFGSKMPMENVIPHLLLIDGVLLHKRQPAGIEASPTLTEEFATWRETAPADEDDDE